VCYVVLDVATSKSHPDNSYFGLAIGFTMVPAAFAVGAISGGAFNPAVSLGSAVMDMFAWPTLWVYLSATLTHPLADQPNSTNHKEAGP
jgi:aquaporin Z